MPWIITLFLCCFKPAEEEEEKVKRKCTNKKARALHQYNMAKGGITFIVPGSPPPSRASGSRPSTATGSRPDTGTGSRMSRPCSTRLIPAKYLLGDGSLQDENREKFIQARKEKLRKEEIKREKARIRRAQEKEASRTALLARLDNKGLLGKEDAARLQEERAREERRRLAAEAAAEIAKKKSLQGKEPPPHSNDSAAGYHDFFD